MGWGYVVRSEHEYGIHAAMLHYTVLSTRKYEINILAALRTIRTRPRLGKFLDETRLPTTNGLRRRASSGLAYRSLTLLPLLLPVSPSPKRSCEVWRCTPRIPWRSYTVGSPNTALGLYDENSPSPLSWRSTSRTMSSLTSLHARLQLTTRIMCCLARPTEAARRVQNTVKCVTVYQQPENWMRIDLAGI
ncbi:hypothetical protein BDY19DRAFT_451979 [Irpex rosettiformis]|uniref:Uncharacterized protein n=1 Tax=Irpex rosettiformis TaxID=378272 RepID=A0ACB8TTH9_9APHY|nr:hypothetical protein BDY19DRAFT_451979 [Irpex rosettiformis]